MVYHLSLWRLSARMIVISMCLSLAWSFSTFVCDISSLFCWCLYCMKLASVRKNKLISRWRRHQLLMRTVVESFRRFQYLCLKQREHQLWLEIYQRHTSEIHCKKGFAGRLKYTRIIIIYSRIRQERSYFIIFCMAYFHGSVDVMWEYKVRDKSEGYGTNCESSPPPRIHASPQEKRSRTDSTVRILHTVT